MKAIIELTQKPVLCENNKYSRTFPIVTIYYDENATFKYIGFRSDMPNGYWFRGNNLKKLIKTFNTYVFYVTELKGKWLKDRTVGSNIKVLDDTFKKEII